MPGVQPGPCHGKSGLIRQGPCAGDADPPQLCIRIRRGMDNVPKIREFHALIQTGTGLETDGRHPEPDDTRQLDHILRRELFFPAV